MPHTTPEACIFCRIARKEIPANIAYESEDYLAFHDLNAQAPTHVLIIPKRHIETLNDLFADDARLVGGMLLVARELAARFGFAEAGYRTVFNCNAAAGQTVWHIHLHLLGGRELGWPPG